MAGEFLESSRQQAPEESLRRAVEKALGKQIANWLAPGTGLSPAARYLLEFSDGTTAFVKAATDDRTEAWLRTEHLALMSAPAWFVPRVYAWIDGPGGFPILVTERLQGHWPASHQGVSWRAGDLPRVFEALRELTEAPAPPGLPPAPNSEAAHWREIAKQPDRALALGLFSTKWLNDSLEALAFAESSLLRTGDRFVHGDVRSDNICLLERRVVFVDWSNAAAGAPRTDLAAFLPTAHLEGGPRPFDVMPDGGAWAAAGAAEQLIRLTSPEELPLWLRRVITRLAKIHLDWAAECLGLPPPVNQMIGGHWV